MDKNLIKAAMRLFFSDMRKIGRTQKIYMRAFLATPRVVGRFHSHVFLLDRPKVVSKDNANENGDSTGKEEYHEEDEEGGDDEPDDAEDDGADAEDGEDEFNPLALLGSVAEGMVLLTSIMEKHASKNPLWPCGLKPAKRLARAVFPKTGNTRRVVAMK
jgi:hypothetical protein